MSGVELSRTGMSAKSEGESVLCVGAHLFNLVIGKGTVCGVCQFSSFLIVMFL